MFRNLWRRASERQLGRGRRRGAVGEPYGRRPRFEPLEDRRLLAIFNVTTTNDVVDAADGKLSLREAINMANAASDLDTIVLKAVVYKIGLVGADDANASGDFDIRNPLEIRGVSRSTTFVDAQHLDRVFHIIGGVTAGFDVTFGNFTIRNGETTESAGGIAVADNLVATRYSNLTLTKTKVTQNSAEGDGGGIWALYGAVHLDRSTVSGNACDGSGGGIFSSNGDVTLAGSTVSGNTSAGNVGGEGGGGIAVFAGNLEVVNSTISGNKASNGGGGVLISVASASFVQSTVSGNMGDTGGGIHADVGDFSLDHSRVSGNKAISYGGGVFTVFGNTTLVNSTISGNMAGNPASPSTYDKGGGIFAAYGIVNLLNSTVSGNTAGDSGGGLFVGLNAQLDIVSSTISGNRAVSYGGGIYARSDTTLTNVTVSGNFAGAGGGGIHFYLGADTATLLNVTVTRNVATFGGGVVRFSGTVNVKNTIIARNTITGGNGPDVNGVFVSQGNNLIGIGNGSAGFPNGVDGNQVGSLAAPINPQLLPLDKYGGPTKTHKLKASSTAVDAGSNLGAPLVDQRGVARPRDGDGDGVLITDIGSFER